MMVKLRPRVVHGIVVSAGLVSSGLVEVTAVADADERVWIMRRAPKIGWVCADGDSPRSLAMVLAAVEYLSSGLSADLEELADACSAARDVALLVDEVEYLRSVLRGDVHDEDELVSAQDVQGAEEVLSWSRARTAGLYRPAWLEVAVALAGTWVGWAEDLVDVAKELVGASAPQRPTGGFSRSA